MAFLRERKLTFVWLVITALLHKSGPEGLSAFLPPSVPGASTPLHLPLVFDEAMPVPANARLFALRLLQRYSYVLGSADTRFVALEDEQTAAARLRDVDEKGAAMVCVNDEIGPGRGRVEAVGKVFKGWAMRRWPEGMGMERAEE